MVEFEQSNDILLLRYEPMNGASWIPARLEDDQTLPIRGTFYLKHKHLVEVVSPNEDDGWDSDEPEAVSFQVATLDGDYFVFDREILGIDAISSFTRMCSSRTSRLPQRRGYRFLEPSPR